MKLENLYIKCKFVLQVLNSITVCWLDKHLEKDDQTILLLKFMKSRVELCLYRQIWFKMETNSKIMCSKYFIIFWLAALSIKFWISSRWYVLHQNCNNVTKTMCIKTMLNVNKKRYFHLYRMGINLPKSLIINTPWIHLEYTFDTLFFEYTS